MTICQISLLSKKKSVDFDFIASIFHLYFVTIQHVESFGTVGLWVHIQQTSFVSVVAVGDRRMLTNPECVGKVQRMPDNPKKKPPKSGWTRHDARVLHISGNAF